MKQVCLICERTSPDRNLYCQELDCPAEMSPNILDYGEWLGDIEIIKPLTLLRSSALYEATHQKKKVLLKIAHPGQMHTDRLKREAEFLRDIQRSKKQDAHLPVLLPPYANTTIDAVAYGRTMLKDHLLYFSLFEHFPGEPLRDVLTKNPQLWVNHVGWLMISLASALAFLQSEAHFHFGVSPEVVLVAFDDDTNVPRILLFDLGIVSTPDTLRSDWYSLFVPPAYTAPELISSEIVRPSYATDVYGLGSTLYELLVGEPAIPFKLRSADDVYNAVRHNQRVRMSRIEDVERVAKVALQAVNENMASRQNDAAVVAEQLIDIFRPVPRKQRRWPGKKKLLLIAAAIIGIVLLIMVAITTLMTASDPQTQAFFR